MSDDFRDTDYRENYNRTKRWTGSAWEPIPKVQTQDQVRIEALEIEVEGLKNRIQAIEDALGKWAITHI